MKSNLIKSMIIINLMFCGNCRLEAQTITDWQKSYGGSDSDGLYCIEQTSDSGYVAAGYTYSNDGDVTGLHGNSDFWLIKINQSGSIQWQKALGGSGFEVASSVHQCSDGGYILAGRTTSNDGDVSGYHGNTDYWVVKVDSVGTLQWQKALGGSNYEFGASAKQTADGGYIVAGYSASIDGDVSSTIPSLEYWIVKLDVSGNIQWNQAVGGNGAEYCRAIEQTSDGGYIVAGNSSTNNNGDVTGNHGADDYWIVKLDSAGNILWQKSLGGSAIDVATAVKQTTDNGFIIAGYSTSLNGDVTGNNGTYDYWIVKTDDFGNIQWQNSLGGYAEDKPTSVQQTDEGGYIVVGISKSINGDVSGNHGIEDYWITKLDANGHLQWQKSLGGSYRDEATSIIALSNGDFIIAGFSNSLDGDVALNLGGLDCWVIKISENLNKISGKNFIDLNSNTTHDAGEPALVNHPVVELTTGNTGFSGPNGNYQVTMADTGSFAVTPAYLNAYYTITPAGHTASFNGINQTDSLNDFAFQPVGVFNDLCISITPVTPFRSGFNATYQVNYTNVGSTTISNVTVVFLPDTDVTFLSANITPAAVSPDSVIWNIGTLTPLQSGVIHITVNVNSNVPIGTLINSGAMIEPVAGDANPSCNTAYWEVLTTGSFDPNDIYVSRDTLFTIEFPNPPYLEYLIRFQNTGTDTAFTVKVLNHMDTSKLQMNTFEFLASSHPVLLNYLFWDQDMEFRFNNILLPDSTNSEPASHGFVRYRIKPVETLVAGNSIPSTAAIYFDFNDPVVTNTAITEVVMPVGIGHLSSVTGSQLAVFPNPFRDEISIDLSGMEGQSFTVGIYDIYGRLVHQLLSGSVTSDKLQVTSNLDGLCSGIYFVRMESDLGSQHVKIIKY